MAKSSQPLSLCLTQLSDSGEEIKALFISIHTLEGEGADFATVHIDFQTLMGLGEHNEDERATILDSLIIQNTFTPHVETAVLGYNLENPLEPYIIPPEDYYPEESTMMTASGIEDALQAIGVVEPD